MYKQLLVFCIGLFLTQLSYAQDFVVKNYSVNITINQDGYFDVVEDYDVYFTRSKHGIYRDIKLKYDLVTANNEQEKRVIEISKIDVPGHKYEATGKFGRRVSNNANIKIGDANKTIIGDVHYTIKYRVKNAFLHEQNATVFYWNLKPTDWFAQFEDMQFTLHLPNGVTLDQQDIKLYSGPIGFTQPSTEFNLTNTNGVITGTAKPEFVSNYGQAVTLLVELPPNSVAEHKPLWPFWNQYGWTFILGGLITGFYLLWRKHGKDDNVVAAISYFPPEGMDPAMAGFLINDREDTSDIISLIPYWGHGGYITVKELEGKGLFSKNDTELIKLKDIPRKSPAYEREVFHELFKNGATTVKISSLKDSFYTTMRLSKSLLKEAAQSYYEPKSRKIQGKVTLALILGTVVLVPTLLYFWGLLAAIGVLLVNLILLIMNFYMIKKNTRGNEVLSELKGFKRFIKTAEEGKLEMLLKDTPNYFESTMGYALTFGALKSWTKKFDKLNVQPPNWYHGTTGGYHSMNNFANSFNSTVSSVSRTMVSSPSSSGSGGGGSSGGGFGGGGGGSW